MRALLLILVAISLSGCGRFDRFMAGLTGDATETCVDGVAYLQFTSGATVKYRVDNLGNYTVQTCK